MNKGLMNLGVITAMTAAMGGDRYGYGSPTVEPMSFPDREIVSTISTGKKKKRGKKIPKSKR